MDPHSEDPYASFLIQGENELRSLLARIPDLPGDNMLTSVDMNDCKIQQVEEGDLVVVLGRLLGKNRELGLKQDDLLDFVSCKLSEMIAAAPESSLRSCNVSGTFINVRFRQNAIYQAVLSTVMTRGEKFGHLSERKGKKIIIEHTSSNPNAPLHIGNLRNVLIGAHQSKLFEAVGYQVDQLFFVNDLGGQIGLTALGYDYAYDKLRPERKIDQWIGLMYATMNTLSQLQIARVEIRSMLAWCKQHCPFGGEVVVEDAVKQYYAGLEANDVDVPKAAEYLDILVDIESRVPSLVRLLIEFAYICPDIHTAAAELNLRYERREPEAVRVFRKMVTDCLCGVQQTCDTFGVRHTRWDFESELGWEGSNDEVMEIVRNSPYFVPQTQNDPEMGGKPRGAYLDLCRFLDDMGMKRGKGGYQKPYPRFYVLRPDGSTLYSYRDLVYSLKKIADADLVFNVICTEQNLAQEKVSVAMQMVTQDGYKQYHMNYEYVKLVRGKMSSRRGVALYADDIFDDLRKIVLEKLVEKYIDVPRKLDFVTEEWLDSVQSIVSDAAMKYSLLCVGPRVVIEFDPLKAADFSGESGPFILYNNARMHSILRKAQGLVDTGLLLDSPFISTPNEVNFDVLGQDEWKIFLDYVCAFPKVLRQIGCIDVPKHPQLPIFATGTLCKFAYDLVSDLSSYYGKVRVLPGELFQEGAQPVMSSEVVKCRLAWIRALLQVLENTLDLLTIPKIDRM